MSWVGKLGLVPAASADLADALTQQRALEGSHLVSLGQHLLGQGLVALLQRLQHGGLALDLGLGGAGLVEDPGILVLHALHERHPLEQIVEPVGFQDDADQVRPVAFVGRSEVRAQGSRGLAQPVLQVDEVIPGGQQSPLDVHQLGLTGRELLLDRVQPPLGVVQPVRGVLDARRLVGDLRLERVPGRLRVRDLALGITAAGGGEGAGQQRAEHGEADQGSAYVRAKADHAR